MQKLAKFHYKTMGYLVLVDLHTNLGNNCIYGRLKYAYIVGALPSRTLSGMEATVVSNSSYSIVPSNIYATYTS